MKLGFLDGRGSRIGSRAEAYIKKKNHNEIGIK